MWPKEYRDYKTDQSLVKHQVRPNAGIIGCEMHELNGWGESYHHYDREKKWFFSSLKTPKEDEQ